MSLAAQVFFLPFAGGSSFAFQPLIEKLPPNIQGIALELPGHGKRMAETLLKDMNTIVNDFYEQLCYLQLPGVPYVLYGHSMGALAGHLLLLKLHAANNSLPIHYFASGRGGPGAHDEEEQYYLLNDDDLKLKLLELGGSPKEVLEHPVLMDFFLPILRADFEAVEQFVYPTYEKLDVPVTVLTGSKEEVNHDQAKLWQQISHKPIDHLVFLGDHFFLFEHCSEITALIQKICHEFR